MKMSLTSLYNSCISGVVCISSGTRGNNSVSSGFFIDDKHIVTCCHCVCSSDGKRNEMIKVFVDIPGSKITNASIVGVDGTADVAVLRVDTPIPGIKPLKWAKEDPKIGDQFILIGSPYGDVQSFSSGYIRDTSFYGSNLLPGVMESLLLDGSALGGNSGGPVINTKGEVIGILAYGYNNVSGGTMNGAVPITIAKPISISMISNQKDYSFGTLRAKLSALYIDDCVNLNIPCIQGYMITQIPFDQKLQYGDIILAVEIDNKKYEVGQLNSQKCIFSLIHLNANKNIKFHIKRGSKDFIVEMVLPSDTSSKPQNSFL